MVAKRTLALILDELVAKSKSGLMLSTSPRSQGDLARAIGMTPTHFSRIRRGQPTLTAEHAKKIAEQFFKGDEYNAKKLVDDLMEARGQRKEQGQIEQSLVASGVGTKREVADELFIGVAGLFRRFGQGSILIVDYRDLPQAAKFGQYHDLLKHVVDAISRGLCFAMIQPFGTKRQLKETWLYYVDLAERSEDFVEIERGARFLHDVASRTISFYREVRSRLREIEQSEGEVRGNIVLYEANRGSIVFPVCGIHSRLFFACYDQDQQQRTEIYQWVVEGDNQHRFRRRDTTSISVDAVKLQFFPIPQYWEKTGKLPSTTQSMREAWKLSGRNELDGRHGWANFNWEIYDDESEQTTAHRSKKSC